MGRSGKFLRHLKGYKAFSPAPLPPANPPLLQDEELTQLLAQANLAIGRLSGLSAIIPDPDLFVYLYVRKEALLSSQIEGTQCSLEDVLNPDVEPISDSLHHDLAEVSNYVKAMNAGLKRLEKLPIGTRLIKEMHAILMKRVRESNKTPGEFRRSQNWIGRPDATLATAEFVPPPPEDVDPLMSDLEKFIHQDDRTPVLIKAALIHAQFETIHPFLDGNGRLGRLLITYLLCYWKVLDKPLLYISYHFKANRTEYYAKLMNIRMRGEWEAWVKFFLRGVTESAEMATQTATEVHHLHLKDREHIHNSKPSASILSVYERFCREPILTNAILVERLESTKPRVQRALDALVEMGLLHEVSGKKRGRRYAYKKYLDILTRDTTTKIG